MKKLFKYILSAFCLAVVVVSSAAGVPSPGSFARHSVYAKMHPQDTTIKAEAVEELALGAVASLQQDTTTSAPDTTAVDTLLPLINWSDTTVYKSDSLGRLVFSEDSLPVIDTFQTIHLRNELDTFLQSYWAMDPDVLPDMDTTITSYFDSISRFLPGKRDIRIAARTVRQEYKDSLTKVTPRILETFAVPESLYYKRILTWEHDSYFNELKIKELDTSYNYHFFDLPIFKEDVDATYLGVSGSASMNMNYFKREKLDEAPFFEPYLPYSYTPETLPKYNTKSPYTELGYWGNPFISKAREESNLRLVCSQNITPALNLTLMYQRFGGNGTLAKEGTDNRTYEIGANYIGKRYSMNAAFFGHKVSRQENGGVADKFWVRDTTVDAKTVDVKLTDADNFLKRRTLYITQSLAVPFNFFRKDKDSLALGDGTVAYIGHSGEYTMYRKTYTDIINEGNTVAREFYNNEFNINPTTSRDSMGVTRFENRFFIKLQPYANDAILSKLNIGIGDQILKYYSYEPSHMVTGNKSTLVNNIYLYGGASGMFRKYLEWDAFGKYYLAGRNWNDMQLAGNLKLSFYPFREGIHLRGHVETTLKEPYWYEQNLYFNHHKWNNEFKKISESRVEAFLEIPLTKTKASFGYALIDNMVYYDSLSVVRQHSEPVHVMSAALEQNFKVWAFHFDHRVLFQMTSNDEVLPLPKITANLRYYLQFNLVKEVLQVQIGANAIFHTSYYLQSYSPDLGVFYNQRAEQFGNNPYLDAFINLQWKRACIFVKYTNVAKGWPASDYFSAYDYIRPERTLKLGMFWPFYSH